MSYVDEFFSKNYIIKIYMYPQCVYRRLKGYEEKMLNVESVMSTFLLRNCQSYISK